MMNKSEDTFFPKSQADWRKWLEKNHDTKQYIWLIYNKASTGMQTINWSQAVDEALCFGWIDSTLRTIDEQKYMQYFTKRKPTSSWSKVNKEKVAKLIQNNLMREAGNKAIEIAKQNGSWNSADAVEALKVPSDLKSELKKYKGAWTYFNDLSKSSKKILLNWVVSAKRPETRIKRITEIVESAKVQSKPKQFQ